MRKMSVLAGALFCFVSSLAVGAVATGTPEAGTGETGDLGQAFLQAYENETAGVVPEMPNMWWKMMEALMVLVILVALIIIIARVLRYFMGGGAGVVRGSGALRLLGSYYFDPKHSIQLLEVNEKVLVVGLAENAVVLLDKIEDAAAVEKLRQAGPEMETARYFGAHLKSAFTRVKRQEDLERSKQAIKKVKDYFQGRKKENGE